MTPTSAVATSPFIELRHVTVRTSVVVEQAETLLADVSLSAMAGEITLVEYTSARHFNCLVDVLCRRRSPDGGEINWLGETFAPHSKSYCFPGETSGIYCLDDRPLLLSGMTAGAHFSFVRRLLKQGKTAQSHRDDEALCSWIGISPNSQLPAEQLSPSEQWLLSLALRLIARPKLLVMRSLPDWMQSTWIEKLMTLLRLWARQAGIVMVIGSHADKQLFREPAYLLHQNQIVNATIRHEAEAGMARSRPAEQAIMIVDREGKLQHANHQTELLLGWSQSELQAADLNTLCKWKVGEGTDLSFERLAMEGGGNNYAVHTQTKEMGEKRLLIHVDPIAAEATNGPVMITLEDDTAKQELERLKQDFASITGHELRTPLTAIRGGLDLLRMTLAERGDENITKLLDMLGQSTQRLQNLSNNLISLSYEGEGIVREIYKSEDWMALIRSTMEPYIKVASGKRVAMRLESKTLNWTPVKCDANRLVEAMANYLENAVEHATEGTEIVLAADLDTQRGRATLTVTNVGQPLSAAAQGSLFTLFFRAREAKDFTNMHLGLGLYVTKRIVERQGGDVWAASDAVRGTNTFGLWLPVGR